MFQTRQSFEVATVLSHEEFLVNDNLASSCMSSAVPTALPQESETVQDIPRPPITAPEVHPDICALITKNLDIKVEEWYMLQVPQCEQLVRTTTTLNDETQATHNTMVNNVLPVASSVRVQQSEAPHATQPTQISLTEVTLANAYP